MSNPFTPPPGGFGFGPGDRRGLSSAASPGPPGVPRAALLTTPARPGGPASARVRGFEFGFDPRRRFRFRLRAPVGAARRPWPGTRPTWRRPRRDPDAAGRPADARLRDDPGDRRTQRRPVAAQPRLGVPDAAAAGRRGPDRGHRKRRQQAAFRADRRRPRPPPRRSRPRRGSRSPRASNPATPICVAAVSPATRRGGAIRDTPRPRSSSSASSTSSTAPAARSTTSSASPTNSDFGAETCGERMFPRRNHETSTQSSVRCTAFCQPA